VATVRQVAQAILDEYLPGRADALEPWRRAVAELATVPPCSKQLGRMIEIAITLDLAGSVPYREALDYLPAVERSRLLSAFGFNREHNISDWRRVRVSEPQTDYLRRDALTMIFAVDLAQQIHDGTPARTRRSGRPTNSRLSRHRHRSSTASALPGTSTPAPADTSCDVSARWAAYKSRWQTAGCGRI